MTNKKKVLLVTEGQKGEVELFNKLFEEFKLSIEREIYCYNTNIYDLYERMFLGNEDDIENMDFLGVLKQKDPQNPILNGKYTDIVLIFDYEPQDNRFSADRIKLMQEYFSESTDNGKLYLNYPMLEAYKHFKEYPDKDYNTRKISVDKILNGEYKKIVGEEAKITSIRNFKRDILNIIIKQNIEKQFYMLGYDSDNTNLKNAYFKVLPIEILNIQNKQLLQKQEIHVLSTCLFFICDYKFDLILENE